MNIAVHGKPASVGWGPDDAAAVKDCRGKVILHATLFFRGVYKLYPERMEITKLLELPIDGFLLGVARETSKLIRPLLSGVPGLMGLYVDLYMRLVREPNFCEN